MVYEIRYSAMSWTPSERADDARGYYFSDFFRGNVNAMVFETEEEAMRKLQGEYLGEDVNGIGVDYSAAVVEIEDDPRPH